MSQNDFNLANQGFPSMRSDINSALQALATNSSGATAPATPYANQFWYETGTNILHIRDEANTAWLDLMVIDGTTGSPSFNSGNVGIGTTSPRARLDLTSSILADDYQLLLSSLRPNIVFEDTSGGSATDFQLYGDGNALAFLYGDASTNIKLASEAMRITNAGNVGIGTTSPSQLLHVMGNVRADSANPSFILAENDTTNQDSRIRLNGGVTLFETLNDDGTLNRLNLSINPTGQITIADLAGTSSRTVTAGSGGVLAAASDSRLKEEVPEALIPSLAEVMLLKPRAYKWLDDVEKRGEDAAVEIGFFADEVKDIIPSAAPMGNDGYYGFYDRSVIAALTNAIQEQQAMIASLEARLTFLEN